MAGQVGQERAERSVATPQAPATVSGNGMPRTRPKTKTAKRVAAQRAAAERAAARRVAAQRRRRWFTVLGVALAVLVVGAGAGLTVWLVNRGDDKPAATTDAAHRSKPKVTAGTGDLTKLTTTTLIKGTGPAVKAGQKISVNYVGVKYKTGEEFDTSWGQEPFSFTLGQSEVIKGWDQGLVGVPVGSRVRLDIPSDLAYGDSGQVAGPLRFVVDVISAS